MGVFDFIKRKKGFAPMQSIMIGNGALAFATDKKGYIDDGFNGSSTVYSIVSIISNTFASAESVLYKVKSQKAFNRYKLLTKSYNPSPELVAIAKAQAFDEVNSHPLLDLLNKPNSSEGGFDFRSRLNASRDITGDAFIWVNRGLTLGDPLELKFLPSQFMSMKVAGDYEVESYVLNIGKLTDFKREEVIHWKHPTLDFLVSGHHLYGQSPLKAACQDYTLTANKEGKKAAAKAFKNQGAGGLISRNEDIVWSEDQRDALITYFDDYINGNDNKGKIRPVNSKITYTQLVQSLADMKVLEALGVTKEELCNIYNFPIHLINSQKAALNNVESSNKYLVTKTVYSRWCSWRDFVNSQLLPMYKDGDQYFYDFDISAFPEVQDDQAKMVESLAKMPITLNEYRGALGWDVLQDANMDKVYIDTTKQPLDHANMDLGANLDQSLSAMNDAGANDYNQNGK